MRSENDGDPLAIVTMLLETDVTTMISDRMTLLPTGNESVGDDGDGGKFTLENLMGPRYQSVAESGILIAVYTLIFLTGIVGNASTCLVIIRNKRMHTATNYYLFSLAVADVLTLLLGKSKPHDSLTRNGAWFLFFFLRSGNQNRETANQSGYRSTSMAPPAIVMSWHQSSGIRARKGRFRSAGKQ